MLEFYHRLACGLFPLRVLFWVVGGIGAAGFAVSLFGPPAWRVEVYNVLAITALLWAVLGGAVAYGFSAPLPRAADDAGRAERFRVALQRGALACFGLFVTALALVVVFSTFRVAGMLMRAMDG